MDTIVDQVKKLAEGTDELGRRKIQAILRDLESSFDGRFDRCIRLASGHLESALAKIGTDLGVFKMIYASDRPLIVSDIAEKSHASPSPELLSHLLRAMGACGMLNESAMDDFNVNDAAIQAFPSFLAENKYQMITSNKVTAFQKAFDTDLTAFEWLSSRPDRMASLSHAMAIQRSGSWLDVLDVEKEVTSCSAELEKAVLVDKKYPKASERIIVQDTPTTLSRAKPVDGIEFAEHDFFKPQTVKGAKFYYLRHILHDWPDNLCIDILKNIVLAMDADSNILIDEVAAYMDLAMMSTLGGCERSRAQWDALLDKAGLKILDVKMFNPTMHASVIVAVPK